MKLQSVSQKLYHCCTNPRPYAQDQSGDYMEITESLGIGSTNVLLEYPEYGSKATEKSPDLGLMELLVKFQHIAEQYQRLNAHVEQNWQAESDHESRRSDAKKHRETAPADPIAKSPKTQLPAPETGPSDSEIEISVESSMSIVFQSDLDFVHESLHQIDCFELCNNSTDTYRDIFASLKEPDSNKRYENMDGAKWNEVLGKAERDRQKGAIYYALTAIALSRWHLGKAWNKKRKTLNTYLVRGRKWSKLEEAFGYGILFKYVWKLGKSADDTICDIISRLGKNPTKLGVLKLLGDQVTLLLHTGRTQLSVFRERLEEQRLNRGTTWFNDELILLCLHLADKRPSVRVGFCIPIHRQNCSSKMMNRPFERAAKEIQRSRDAGTKEAQLVHFFPLLHHGNHFSILEEALMREDQFRGLTYIDEVGPLQHNGFSCGPLVVAFARSRMQGERFAAKDLEWWEALQLRVDVLDLVEKAYNSDKIHAAVKTNHRRKRKIEKDEADGSRKRVHGEDFGGRYDSNAIIDIITID
ncbi:hypothetical protein F5X99DRAFT_410703 [Biscogniauxia marginata]|nr:hypothetical protein F5X99DRAFT_410703 [Biscogniauxia marginata]